MNAELLQDLMRMADLYALSYAEYFLHGGEERLQRSKDRRNSLSAGIHKLYDHQYIEERRRAERRCIRCREDND